MSLLVDSLSCWRGRRQVQIALKEHGFLIPEEWQNFVVNYCGIAWSEEINRYWDEIAQECVCSAGLVTSRTREFKGETTYRSKYLDQLAEAANYAEPPFREPELHRCLYEFEKRIYYDKSFGIQMGDAIEAKKREEFERIGLSIEGWTGKKSDVKPIFQNYIEAQGFVSKRGKFTKETTSGLIFQCWVDVGGRSECSGGLPLYFFIFHKTMPEIRFEVSVFHDIVPGFGYYGRFKSPFSAVLGISAHVQMFEILFRSLDGK